jgi:hypothetical protein
VQSQLQARILQGEPVPSEADQQVLPDLLLMACNMPAQGPPPPAYRQRLNAASIVLCSITKQIAVSAGWKQWAEQLDSELAGDLFLAAALRKNTQAMSLLDSINPDAVPAAAITTVLTEAVQQRNNQWLGQVCRHSAATACRAAVVVPLLLSTLKQGYAAGIKELFDLPGLLQQLGAADVSSLLLAALKAPARLYPYARPYINNLLKLPVAQDMQPDSFEAILIAALKRSNKDTFSSLVSNIVQQLAVPAQQMSFDVVHRIYKAAVQRCDDASLRMYVQLPAVRTATAAQLKQLMELSLELTGTALSDQQRSVSSNGTGFNALCSFPQAQQLSHDMIWELLNAAFGVITKVPEAAPLLGKCWMLLCQLPQAHLINPRIVINCLAQSLGEDRQQAVAALCKLLDQAAAKTAWGGLTSQEAEYLLAGAVPIAQHGAVASLRKLCSMQCVEQVVDTSAVVRLLGSVLVFGGVTECRDPAAATRALLQLPAAAAIPAWDMARMCGCMVQQCTYDDEAEEILQELQRKGSLPGPGELTSLITVCLLSRTHDSAVACVCLLCRDNAAQQVDSGTVQQLLLRAVELQQPLVVQVLLQALPAVLLLGGEQVQQLLCATVKAALDTYSKDGNAEEDDRMSASWQTAVEAVAGAATERGVDADMLLQLMEEAVKCGAAQCLQTLVKVRTQQQLPQAGVGSLLQLAVQQQEHACLLLLLQLPGAASSLNAEQMAGLLQDSVQFLL